MNRKRLKLEELSAEGTAAAEQPNVAIKGEAVALEFI